ncbi:uncharacterized protein LOC113357981 [Papaver somniferum]|uniref:uncharacterized protein LOC113357981 n=1 Tax=Papaver somniferum TaxID=3469 RepID=UPI000E6F7BCE|nr:uncharacterized protein LOC113357981 [Papaver somniferum]
MQLTSPLKRGPLLRTTSGGEAWVKYYWEKQPYNVCDQCFVIDHSDDNCEQIAQQLQLDSMSAEEYEAWSLEQEEDFVDGAAPEGNNGDVNINGENGLGTLITSTSVTSQDGSLLVDNFGENVDNSEERNSKRYRGTSEPFQNNINSNQSISSLLISPITRSNQPNLKIAATNMTINQPESSTGNLIEPMDGVEMEEIEAESAVEGDLTLINIMEAAKKGTTLGARPSQV